MANLPGGGRGLGMASGAIRIDTSDLNRAEQTSARVGERISRSLSQTGRGAAELDRNFRDVAVAARQLATAVERAFGNVERSADRATTKVSRMNQALLRGASTFAGTALGGTAGGIAGALAFGQPAIAAGLALGQASRAAQDQVATSIQSASDLTESINKVGVAFDQSGREILDWSKNSATALGQSRQQALEAASSFGLMFRTMGFVPEEAARMSKGLVQLATDLASINNISPEEALTKLRAGLVGEIEPLRRVGVLLDVVSTEAKAMELGLAASTEALTQQDKVLARYHLILEQTALTQGDFARTSNDAANLQRILAAQVKDFNTELGKTILPGYVVLLQGATTAMSRLNTIVETGTGAVEKYARAWREVINFVQLVGPGGVPFRTAIDLAVSRPIPAGTSRTGQRLAAGRAAQSGDTGRFKDDQTSLIVDRQRQIDAIERNANEARIDATEQFEEQRTSTIRRYERTIAREAEDFARQRARAEQQLVRDIAEVREDSADRQIEIERNLSRRVEDIQEQLADRQGDIRERLGERESDIREQVGRRLLDIEEDYQRNRERATRDHRDNLLDAASRLDARAILEEQRRFKRQQEDLLEARDDQVEQAQEGADEQLEQAREAADDQLEQAREAADDQLQQAREAAQEQLDQQRRQAEERIQELRTEFEDRKREEDEDRAIRLQRMAEDHQDQLDEQARQHGVRLQQISDQEQEERDLLDAEFQKSLADLELQTDAWIKEQERLTERAIENFDKWWEAVNRRFGVIPPALPSTGGERFGLPEMSFQSGGFVPRDMVARLHAGEFVVPRSQVQNMGGISIIVQGGPGGEGTAIAVRNELESLLRSFGGV